MSLPKGPALTVDCVAFDRKGRVLLVRRANPPFAGHYALPGGFVERGETVEAACRREFLEETGLEAGPLHWVGVYSDPARDPRGATVSLVWLTVIDATPPKAGSDAATAAWISDWQDRQLAFDHNVILSDAQKRLKELKVF